MKKYLLAILLVLSSTAVSADDFTETIDAALKAYQEGDIGKAKEELTYASQLLNQMRASSLDKVFPEPLAGWKRHKAKEKNSSNAGLSMFGGGTTAEAHYRNGDERIDISIIADSPMVQGLSMLFSNLALAGAEGTMKRINGQKALIKSDGSITTLIDKRIMVSVSGRAPMEAKEAYFAAIDFAKVKAY